MSVTVPETTKIEPQVDPLKDLPVLPAEPEIPDEVVLLRKARDYIAQPRKWIKWGLRKHSPDSRTYDQGATCAVGAVYTAAGLYDDIDDGWIYHSNWTPFNAGRADIIAAIDALDEGAGGSIMSLNDDGPTRKQDVIDAFNKAINSLLTH